MNNSALIFRSIAFSALLHLILLMAALITINASKTDKKTKTYMVSLIEDYRALSPLVTSKQEALTKSSDKLPTTLISNKKNNISEKLSQEKILKDRIEAIEAKKKIEKIVALRKIIDISDNPSPSGKLTQKPNFKNAHSVDINSSSITNDYFALIVSKIRREWVYPESLDRNLEAIISIKILSDGSVKIEKIEKSSGNPVFDRYALRAINKASPLPPPPKELEVGIRFNP
ncbi:MAG: TonB family protein [Thermodesulfovibrionales bacterium]|nr:TonB family protein [Thermodesulfovibrionales bacterium]